MQPTKYQYNAAVVVGRWQLPHLGHGTLFTEALKLAPLVIIVIGSSFKSRDPRNPFMALERSQMISASLSPEERKRVLFLPVRDYFDDDRWNQAVRKGVASLTQRVDKVALVAFKKDHTTYYVDNFSGWNLVRVEPQVDVDATALRRVFFETVDDKAADTILGNYVHPATLAYLRAWSKLPAYARAVTEHLAVVEYRKKWPGTHLTADAVVRVADHVLLIQRGGAIGHDLWALPGGFVDPGELFMTAALRELQEETHFPFPAFRMREALKSTEVFEHPLRSPRGRIVTKAHYFAFAGGERPEVSPGDDAKAVGWFHIDKLTEMEDQIFEDHSVILDHFMDIFNES